jgi:hypothetical protein
MARRPAAELLLLAELVGLIILERHQIFEPVSSKVDEIGADVKAMQILETCVHLSFDARAEIPSRKNEAMKTPIKTNAIPLTSQGATRRVVLWGG